MTDHRTASASSSPVLASPATASLVLASASPQRARLLEQLGLSFKAVPADIDETPRADEAAAALVERLARAKAEALSIAYAEARIIGSDTVVVRKGPRASEQIFGKPVDGDDAARMLSALSGQTHQVMTGVAVSWDGITRAQVVVTQVRMRALSAADIQTYWASGEPRGKAGAYAIQGIGAQFIEHIAGSYSAVMGLPLHETAILLGQTGFESLGANRRQQEPG